MWTMSKPGNNQTAPATLQKHFAQIALYDASARPRQELLAPSIPVSLHNHVCPSRSPKRPMALRRRNLSANGPKLLGFKKSAKEAPASSLDEVDSDAVVLRSIAPIIPPRRLLSECKPKSGFDNGPQTFGGIDNTAILGVSPTPTAAVEIDGVFIGDEARSVMQQI